MIAANPVKYQVIQLIQRNRKYVIMMMMTMTMMMTWIIIIIKIYCYQLEVVVIKTSVTAADWMKVT